MRDICARMSKIDYICQVIKERFGLKARPWQVSVVVDITLKKKNIYAIASNNTDKILVYQIIPVVIGGSILVLSPTIALIEDQIRISSKYYLYDNL